MTFSTDRQLQQLVTQHFPAAQAAFYLSPLDGLSGNSVRVSLPEQTLLARRATNVELMPGIDRQREYRILQKLRGSGIVPLSPGRSRDWLLLEWLPGTTLSDRVFADALEPLTALVVRLHRQPLTGYRFSLTSLLMEYWQRSAASRRHPLWLRTLLRLRRAGEPRPLRLAVLHMDIHAGNVIMTPQGLRLIDWEYASDGDVALELAAIIVGNALSQEQQQQLIATYADAQQLERRRLWQQIQCWRPWLLLLTASWYELRWQQTGEEKFAALAASGWQQLSQTN